MGCLGSHQAQNTASVTPAPSPGHGDPAKITFSFPESHSSYPLLREQHLQTAGDFGGISRKCSSCSAKRPCRMDTWARAAPLPSQGCPTDSRINWALQEKERVQVKPSAGAGSRHLRAAAVPHRTLWLRPGILTAALPVTSNTPRTSHTSPVFWKHQESALIFF